MKKTFAFYLVGLMGCSRLFPLPIGGTQAQNAAVVPTKSLFVGAGQSNMAYENLGVTFSDYKNVAVGGTGIAQWQKGGTLYQNMIDACKNQKMPCVILFWQGEAETSQQAYDAGSTQSWPCLFLRMVDDLRKDIGYKVPVVYCQIGQSNGSLPYWDLIKQEQTSIEGSRCQMAMVVTGDLYPDTGDDLHYGQDQYPIFQKRMVRAYEDMKR